MHETVTKLRAHIRNEAPTQGVAGLVSRRLQEITIARALAEPLSGHFENLYLEAYRWLRFSDRLLSEDDTAARARLFGELMFASRHIRVSLGELPAFWERVEDNLSERDEVTHRESAFEREVAPFNRLDSIRPFRDLLVEKAGFSLEAASDGAQAEADLLKVVYTTRRLEAEALKAFDAYALAAEMVLDARRHLIPAFTDGSRFLAQVRRAAD
jgi:hypothetical protein